MRFFWRGFDVTASNASASRRAAAQVRAYAKFHLQRAKNDRIDLIASCTASARKIHAAPDPRMLPFAEQLTMIDQINEDISRLKNRIESCRNARIKQLWQEISPASSSARRPSSRPWSPPSASIPTSPAGLRLLRSPALHPTATAASRPVSGISRAGESGCAAPFIRLRWRHRFAGTGSSSSSTNG